MSTLKFKYKLPVWYVKIYENGFQKGYEDMYKGDQLEASEKFDTELVNLAHSKKKYTFSIKHPDNIDEAKYSSPSNDVEGDIEGDVCDCEVHMF